MTFLTSLFFFPGPSLKQAGSYLSAAILSGLLQNSPALGGGDSATLNLVNSPALAKQMGLDVSAFLLYQYLFSL